MGSERALDGQVGHFLAAFDPRLSPWALETSATEAGAYPGEAVAGEATQLTITPSGTGTTSTVYIQEQTGGYPGAGSTFGWRTNTGAAWYGWDPPFTATYTELVDWDAANAATDNAAPTMVVTADDEVLLVAEDRPVGLGRSIVVALRETDGDWVLGASSIYDEDVSASARALWPCVVKMPMPDNRLRIYHLHYDDDISRAQVWCWELTPDTAPTTASNWALISRACLSSPIVLTGGMYPGALRVVVGRAQLMLCYCYGSGASFDIVQCYSRDAGVSFTEVATVDSVALGRFGLTFAGGFFVLAHVGDDDTSTDDLLEVRRVANAATSLATVDPITVRTDITGGLADAVEIDFAVDPSGHTWLYLSDTGSEDFQAFLSEDGGGTWRGADDDRGRRCYGDKRIAQIATVWWRDRTLHVHRTSDATGYDGCLICDHLGGYATKPLPLSGYGSGLMDRMSFTRTWTAHTDPGNVFTQNTTGTPTAAFNSDGAWVIQSTAGEAYELAAGGGAGGAEMCRVALDNVSQTTRIYVSWTDGVDYSTLLIEATGGGASPHTISLSDPIGLVGLDSVTTAAAGPVELLIWVKGESYQVWYRAWSGSASTDTLVGTGSPTSSGGLSTAAGTTSGVRFVVGDSGGAVTYECKLHLLASLRTQGTAVEKACGYGLDYVLYGRPLTSRPAVVVEGLAIQGEGGPSRQSDSWTIAPDAEYATRQASWTADYPSPRTRWRSTSTAQQTLAWVMSDGVPSRALSPLWVVALAYPTQKIGISWYDGSNWTTETAVTLYHAVTCTLTGSTLRPTSSSSNTGGTWYDEDALAGGYVVSGSSGTGACRRILRNTAGVLEASSSVTWRRAELTLGDIDGTETTSSTTWRIVPPQALLLIRSPATMGGLRVRWSVDSNHRQTPDDYVEGKVLAGPAYVLGYDHGRDAVWTVDVPSERAELRNGRRVARQPAPARRTVELSWQASLELLTTRGATIGATVAPDYVKAWPATADPAASVGEAHATIGALVARWAGDGVPVVYGTYDRSQIPSSETDIRVLRRGWIVGAVDPTWTWEHAGHGEEELSEAFRLGALTIREVV